METLPAEMQMMFTTEANEQLYEPEEAEGPMLEEVCEESYPHTQRTGTAGVSKCTSLNQSMIKQKEQVITFHDQNVCFRDQQQFVNMKTNEDS